MMHNVRCKLQIKIHHRANISPGWKVFDLLLNPSESLHEQVKLNFVLIWFLSWCLRPKWNYKLHVNEKLHVPTKIYSMRSNRVKQIKSCLLHCKFISVNSCKCRIKMGTRKKFEKVCGEVRWWFYTINFIHPTCCSTADIFFRNIFGNYCAGVLYCS